MNVEGMVRLKNYYLVNTIAITHEQECVDTNIYEESTRGKHDICTFSNITVMCVLISIKKNSNFTIRKLRQKRLTVTSPVMR